MNRIDTKAYLNAIFQGQTEEAKRIRMKNVPNKIVKFISLGDDELENQKKLESLSDGKLWFSKVEEFNDPYELRGIISLENKNLEKYIDFRDSFSVCCLSGRSFGYLPMWAYYTNNYKGFCIEFSVVKKDAIHPVLYIKNRISAYESLKDIEENAYKAMESGKKDMNLQIDLNIFWQQFFMKDMSWQHEDECRLLSSNVDESQIGNSEPINNYGLKINRIIAGLNCSERNKKCLNEISRKYTGTNAYYSKLSSIKYGCEIETL